MTPTGIILGVSSVLIGLCVVGLAGLPLPAVMLVSLAVFTPLWWMVVVIRRGGR